jgi:hypothetical protein
MLSRALLISTCIPRASLDSAANRAAAFKSRQTALALNIASSAIGGSISISAIGQIRNSGMNMFRIFRPLLTIRTRIIDGGKNIVFLVYGDQYYLLGAGLQRLFCEFGCNLVARGRGIATMRRPSQVRTAV